MNCPICDSKLDEHGYIFICKTKCIYDVYPHYDRDYQHESFCVDNYYYTYNFSNNDFCIYKNNGDGYLILILKLNERKDYNWIKTKGIKYIKMYEVFS